jgi:recombination protein RecT
MATNNNEKPLNQITVFKGELDQMGAQFEAALPAHIPLERFIRVVMTAAQNNPDLVNKCTRRSLFNSCVKAAQDGLLPDGREGAIVPYGADAQWLPMIFGLRKKVRNSGELIDWDVHLVYENDHFEHELGDNAFIRHKRSMGPRGEIVGGYSIAHLKDGGTSREIMSIDEIESIRKRTSKAKSDKSPWNVAEYYGEMCRKTIARRHSKNLPMSSDLDDLIRRDDDLYSFDDHKGDRPARRSLNDTLDKLAGPGAQTRTKQGADETPPSDDDTGGGGTPQDNGGQETQGSGTADGGPKEERSATNSDSSSTAHASDQPGDPKQGGETVNQQKEEKTATPKPPKTEREYVIFARAWFATEPVDNLRKRWAHIEEKNIRNKANVSPEAREELFGDLVSAENDRKAK